MNLAEETYERVQTLYHQILKILLFEAFIPSSAKLRFLHLKGDLHEIEVELEEIRSQILDYQKKRIRHLRKRMKRY